MSQMLFEHYQLFAAAVLESLNQRNMVRFESAAQRVEP
jgi:hypothetical protein